MKKSLIILAAAICFAACNQNEPDHSEEQKTNFAAAKYFEALGTNNVSMENFSLDSVRVEAVVTSDTTLDICLYQISFSPKMPVTIDMVIPHVTYTRTDNELKLSADNIAPTMGGKPFDKYTITQLNGYITPDSIVFTNNYGTYSDCSYRGAVTQFK